MNLSNSARLAAAGIASVALGLGLAACGSGDSDLSQLAQQGKNTANGSGCASCHGANGQGGVGPSWIDLAGSQRLLTDGSTVTADREYLVRSILEPQVEVVDGFTLLMPSNGLSEAQANDIATYIEELVSNDE